jgi:hypothetical protein
MSLLSEQLILETLDNPAMMRPAIIRNPYVRDKNNNKCLQKSPVTLMALIADPEIRIN